MTLLRFIKHASACFLLTSILIGCGGSGGGQKSNSVNFNNTVVEFNADLDDSLQPEEGIVAGTLSGDVEQVYIIADIQSSRLIADTFFTIDGNTGNLHLYPFGKFNLGPGNHSESIRIRVCEDANCNRELSGSPQWITVNYNIVGDVDFTLDRTVLEFSSIHNRSAELPESQTISYASSVSRASINHSPESWVEAEFLPFEEQIQFTIVEALPPGTHTATFEVGAYENSTQTVTVEYVVEESIFMLSNELLNYNLSLGDNSITEHEISIEQRSGDAFDWEIRSDIEWLDISNMSGHSETDIHTTIQLNEKSGFVEPGVYTADIHITAGDALFILPIVLTVDAPMVTSIHPYISRPNQLQTVTILGQGFDGNITELFIGEQAIDQFEVINDKMISAHFPALDEGDYSIRITNDLPIDLESTQYKVRAIPDIQENIVAGIDFYNTIYDSERQCFYRVPEHEGYTVYRTCHVAGSLPTNDDLNVSDDAIYSNVTLTPDGRHIIAYGIHHISVIDASTFSIKHTYRNIDLYDLYNIVFYSNSKAFLVGAHDLAGFDINQGILDQPAMLGALRNIGLVNPTNQGNGIIDISSDLTKLYYYKNEDEWDYFSSNKETESYVHVLDLTTLETREVPVDNGTYVTASTIQDPQGNLRNAYRAQSGGQLFYAPRYDTTSNQNVIDVHSVSENDITNLGTIELSDLPGNVSEYSFLTNYDGTLGFLISYQFGGSYVVDLTINTPQNTHSTPE